MRRITDLGNSLLIVKNAAGKSEVGIICQVYQRGVHCMHSTWLSYAMLLLCFSDNTEMKRCSTGVFGYSLLYSIQS
jgi:hypothetical protein